MSQRSRSGGGTGRRPKDARRTGPGRASPPASRVTGARTRGGTATRGGRSYNPRLLAAAVIGGLLVFAALAFGLIGGGGNGSPSQVPTGSGAAAGCPTSQPAALARGDTRTVTIQTAKGTIVIQVKGSFSPIATGNFVALASCGYYDGVTFHRLVPGFVIQGGDREFGLKSTFDASKVGTGGPGYTITDEPIATTYHRGTVAMARSSQANSQGSQFFIVLSDGAASTLASANPGYAILGEVTSGMNVVDAIAAMPNSGSDSGNTATDPVAMDHVTVSTP